MNSYIYLDNISIYAYHGVSSQETKVGNTFFIDLKLKVDLRQAIESDDLSLTVNYADIYQSVSEEMAIHSKLLEHVAGRIVRRLFAEYPTIEAIDIKLSKQNPPIEADITSAGVELHCNKLIF
ncbi:MAG: dihydroneopterin aldolase [Mediterranea sp.]|jgi:dihydroneopterin aldolase|nr:dihydroneopterin aldolase [Mediterranea sp.]